jgi:DNA-binding GntR family transcriptional regulator
MSSTLNDDGHEERGLVDSVVSPRLLDSALNAVRNSILEGRIGPGERLLEVKLAQQLGISRGPLREALHLLEKDGIIYSVPRRGKFVQLLDLTTVDEVYSLRKLLEAFAVERFVADRKLEELTTLEAALAPMREAAEAGDVRLVARRDIEFHQAIIGIAHHSLITAAWRDNISGKMHVLLNITEKTHRPLDDVLIRHTEIIEGLRTGTREAVTDLIRNHIDDGWLRARRQFIDRPTQS